MARRKCGLKSPSLVSSAVNVGPLLHPFTGTEWLIRPQERDGYAQEKAALREGKARAWIDAQEAGPRSGKRR